MDIKFINLSDNVRLEEGDVFQMVESTVYFEAYRHILEGLKEVDPARLPLQVRSALGKHYTTSNELTNDVLFSHLPQRTSSTVALVDLYFYWPR